jgi:hypothetical protein
MDLADPDFDVLRVELGSAVLHCLVDVISFALHKVSQKLIAYQVISICFGASLSFSRAILALARGVRQLTLAL